MKALPGGRRKKRTFTGKISYSRAFYKKTKAMKILKTVICAVLLVAGLCGCEKMIPEINLTENLEGSWEKVYPSGVQDAGQVIWTFSSINKESQSPFILTIHVSDVFSGDSEVKYIYQQHQNGYPGVGSSSPELYLFELDHDFMQDDRKTAYTPAARYYVKECSKDKLVLTREEVNVDGENLLEGDITFKRRK